mmetsp:Transcript_106332/g.297662  ORF Transcript_106332/g.297662 Transcript_106332/m.297662 type:complete len:187 (+) Transcript_106332:53-613(+)
MRLRGRAMSRCGAVSGALRWPRFRVLVLSAAFAWQLAEAGIFSSYTRTLKERECTCNCCIRQHRRPSEVVGDALFKCAMPPAGDSRVKLHDCNDRCIVLNDPVLPSSTIVDMNRFCFYHCQPTSGGSQTASTAAFSNQDRASLFDGGSLIDAECISVSGPLLEQAASPDHNGRDTQLHTGSLRSAR